MVQPLGIPFDRDANTKTVRHQQLVGAILNSLLLHGELIQTGVSPTEVWHLGYVPAVAGNWTGTPPNNIKDALDRIAVALVAAGHTP